MDRLMIGVAVMGLGLVDTTGVGKSPFTTKIDQIEYPAQFQSKKDCTKQLKFLKIKHDIDNLECKPNA